MLLFILLISPSYDFHNYRPYVSCVKVILAEALHTFDVSTSAYFVLPVKFIILRAKVIKKQK